MHKGMGKARTTALRANHHPSEGHGARWGPEVDSRKWSPWVDQEIMEQGEQQSKDAHSFPHPSIQQTFLKHPF